VKLYDSDWVLSLLLRKDIEAFFITTQGLIHSIGIHQFFAASAAAAAAATAVSMVFLLMLSSASASHSPSLLLMEPKQLLKSCPMIAYSLSSLVSTVVHIWSGVEACRLALLVSMDGRIGTPNAHTRTFVDLGQYRYYFS